MDLQPGQRVLDCAAGTGQLAVGLTLRGFDVVASDASSAMVDRIRRLAVDHGVELSALTCPWERLSDQNWSNRFRVVFCVGNSLTHAAGQAARRAALGQMASVLQPGGVLVLTSRNWELVREQGSGIRIGNRLVERNGRQGLVVYGWTIGDAWDDPHALDVGVALIEPDGEVTNHAERLAFWPFTHLTLEEDLRAAGLSPVSSTYAPEVERYLVTAERPDWPQRRAPARLR